MATVYKGHVTAYICEQVKYSLNTPFTRVNGCF